MKYIVLILLFTLSQGPSIAQLDYDDIRGNIISYCGKVDDSIILKNAHFVDSVSRLKIDFGLNHFLEDYARAMYEKFLITKNQNDLILSINANTRRWEQFGSTLALYNLASGYAVFDCFMSLKYLEILEEKIEKNELDYPENKDLFNSQIAIIRDAVCPDPDEYTLDDYKDIFAGMKSDALYYLEEGKKKNSKEIIRSAQNALQWLEEAEQQTDVKDLDGYYNEIAAELLLCGELMEE